MATTSAVSTPTRSMIQTVSSNAPPGNWKHPRFDEITRRLEATTFGDRNIRTMTWSVIYLVCSFILPAVLDILPFTRSIMADMAPIPLYLILAARFMLVFNILYALLPLFRKPDDLSDIPLTPSQRALLGLSPASLPATPGSQYITPPSYSRSSASRRTSRSLSGSPYSGKNSPLGVSGGSPYSASPLLHKAIGGGVARRLSYGTPSPNSFNPPSNESTNSVLMNTPSPTTGRTASVGLNSRWLYERGKWSPSMRAYYS